MDWQGWLSLGTAIGVLLTLGLTRLQPQVVTMAALALLVTTGVLSGEAALQGFANPGLATVAAMFVVAAGIQASGGSEWIVNRWLGRPQHLRPALARLFAPVVLLSSALNNTPVVATMIPAVHSWARKTGLSASRLMIPLSYASILGGTLTLIGTSTNLVVNGQYQTLTGAAGFSLFAITGVGAIVAVTGLLFMWLCFPRWLPDRQPQRTFGNTREFTLEVAVARDGPLVGKSIEAAGLRHLRRVYLVEIERDGTLLTAVDSGETLRGDDRLVFAGDTQAITDLLAIKGIVASPENGTTQPLLQDRAERRLVEAVVSPHCEAIGQAIRDARFRDRYGAVVLAVARNGERIKGNLGTIQLEAGDTLLLEARPAFVSRQRYNRDFLLVSELDTQPPRHEKAWLAWTILLAVILSAGLGVLSMLNAALLGALLMLAAGCCSLAQAERNLDLSVLVTIGASFALGLALEQSGAALFLASNIMDLSGGRPWLMLVLIYVAVSLLTETITNNAAALLMLPVALNVTANAGLAPEPFLLAIMFAASASFATPLGYQTNLMVYGPGGYRFSDFLRVGIPMNLVVGASALLSILWLWPLEVAA